MRTLVSSYLTCLVVASLFVVCYVGFLLTPALCLSPTPVPRSCVLAVALSPDGKTLASGGFDGKIVIWQVATGERITTLPEFADAIHSLEFSPDGATLASVSGDRLRLWNTSDWSVRRLFSMEPYMIDAAFSPDGKSIAAAASYVCVWDLSTGELRRKMDDDSLCVGYASSGRVVSGGWDGELVLWDVVTGKPQRRIHVNDLDLRSVEVSPNGTFAACGGWSETATVWDISTGKKILAVNMGESSGLPVCFSPDSRLLAVGGTGGLIKLADISTGKTIRAFQGGKSEVYSLACSPDGNYIAAGYEDGSICIWDASTGKRLHEWKGHSAKLRR